MICLHYFLEEGEDGSEEEEEYIFFYIEGGHIFGNYISQSLSEGGVGLDPSLPPPFLPLTYSEPHMALQMLCLSPGNSFVDPPISVIKSYYHLTHISIKFLDPPTSNDNEHQ